MLDIKVVFGNLHRVLGGWLKTPTLGGMCHRHSRVKTSLFWAAS